MASAATSFMARRPNSSASLAQFFKEHNDAFRSTNQQEGDLDFCNAFWGEDDAGYEVIMARLRASGRTMDELKAFWKERCGWFARRDVFWLMRCGYYLGRTGQPSRTIMPNV